MDTTIYLIPLFFLTALVYSSVGFGGGSTYLALLVLFSFPYETMPQVALVCNIVVVTGGLIHFARAGVLKLRRILPFVILSVPFAYLGGLIPISKTVFLILLGFSLGAAGIRLLLTGRILEPKKNISFRIQWISGLTVGSFLGFVSGLVGIGGGIFLAPILYFLRWGKAQEIAAAASLFIFVNSMSGLLGQWTKNDFSVGNEWNEGMSFLVLAVFIGGQIGSRLSARVFSSVYLQRITACLILLVSGRIFWGLL